MTRVIRAILLGFFFVTRYVLSGAPEGLKLVGEKVATSRNQGKYPQLVYTQHFCAKPSLGSLGQYGKTKKVNTAPKS